MQLRKKVTVLGFYASHAVLAIGFQWYINNSGIPIAELFSYHDPNPYEGENLSISGNTLKSRFIPCNGWYWAIVGNQEHIQNGNEGYDEFLSLGGTYYGGPANYNPEEPVY